MTRDKVSLISEHVGHLNVELTVKALTIVLPAEQPILLI